MYIYRHFCRLDVNISHRLMSGQTAVVFSGQINKAFNNDEVIPVEYGMPSASHNLFYCLYPEKDISLYEFNLIV